VIHYYWLVKSDIRKPVMYGAIVVLLLGYRVGVWFFGKGRPMAGRDSSREKLMTSESAY
jgi:DMSO/TMAO reductase YedYZ heme-binding membrane subunit